MLRTLRFVPLAVLPVLSACMVGPDYVRPQVEAPSAYKEAEGWKTAQPMDHLPRGRWWEIFSDPQLNALEAQVEISNLNIRIAEAQFRQAQAVVRASRAGYFPVVGGSVSAARSMASSNTGEHPAGKVAKSPVTDYKLTLDAAWEPDVWGRVGRLVEAGQASAEASASEVESVRLSAQAALAQDYFLLATADAQKALFERTVTGYERSFQSVRNQYAAGVATQAEVAQAETQLKTAQAELIDLGVRRAQFEHAIALLLGKTPSAFAIKQAALPASPPSIPFSVPSAMLERRPDIASAERRVAAANATIGVTKAAYFPALVLSAAGGFESALFPELFTVPSRVWALGASLVQSVFDGGLRHAESDRAVAAYDATVVSYRQTVLGAFQEVEDNLAALRILEQEAQVQDEAVKAARRAVVQTTNQYRAGTVSYLNVVTVQSTALTIERTAVDLQGRRLTASVLLVKALGGGWGEPAQTSQTSQAMTSTALGKQHESDSASHGNPAM